MIDAKTIGSVVSALISAQCYQATKYISDREVITVTKRRYRGLRKQWDKRDRFLDFSLKIGKPNYRERKFIAVCKKANEPFPVKKIQFREFPERRH